jgi:hypothetical protein
MVLDVCIQLKEDRSSRAQQELLPFPLFCVVFQGDPNHIITFIFILFYGNT